MNSVRVTMIVMAFAALLSGVSASAQEIVSVYTKFDADKTCKHTKGTEVEDYGSCCCPGYGGLIVRLLAGDQRMTVSFGTSAKKAQGEVAASETFPCFNSVYEGVVEWRIEKWSDAGSFLSPPSCAGTRAPRTTPSATTADRPAARWW